MAAPVLCGPLLTLPTFHPPFCQMEAAGVGTAAIFAFQLHSATPEGCGNVKTVGGSQAPAADHGLCLGICLQGNLGRGCQCCEGPTEGNLPPASLYLRPPALPSLLLLLCITLIGIFSESDRNTLQVHSGTDPTGSGAELCEALCTIPLAECAGLWVGVGLQRSPCPLLPLCCE